MTIYTFDKLIVYVKVAKIKKIKTCYKTNILYAKSIMIMYNMKDKVSISFEIYCRIIYTT